MNTDMHGEEIFCLQILKYLVSGFQKLLSALIRLIRENPCTYSHHPRVVPEMDRREAMVVSLRLIRVTNLAGAAETNLMSPMKWTGELRWLAHCL